MQVGDGEVRMHDVHIERNREVGQTVARMRLLLTRSAAVRNDPHDWSEVVGLLDPQGTGSCEFKTWQRVAQSAVDPEKGEALVSDEVVYVIWGASDLDNTGTVATGALVGLLRRVAALPDTPVAAGTTVHTLLVVSARKYAVNPARLKNKKPTGVPVQRQPLEHVDTRWDNIVRQGSEGGPWSVIRVRDRDGNVTHGPWAGPGHWMRRHAKDPRGAWESWLGEEELTDHAQLPSAVDAEDAKQQFLHQINGTTRDDEAKARDAPPADGPDDAWVGGKQGAFRTAAVLCLQTTAHTAAKERAVMEISCELVNVRTRQAIAHHQVLVRPAGGEKGVTRLTQALTNARLEGVEQLPELPEALSRLEQWLRDRRVLEGPEGAARMAAANPTVFVVTSDEQLQTILPAQCEAMGVAYPPYLRSWCDLALLFRRHLRCGHCEACSTKRPGECSGSCDVPEMLHIVDRHPAARRAQGGGRGADEEEEDAGALEVVVYNIPQQVVLDGPVQLRGSLYCLVSDRAKGDQIGQWMLRVFETDGQDVWYEHTTDGGPAPPGAGVAGPSDAGVDVGRAPRSQFGQLDQLATVRPDRVGVQAYGLVLRFRVPTEQDGVRERVLAAESREERDRWLQGLSRAVLLHGEGGGFVREMEEGLRVERGLAGRAVGLLGLDDKEGARLDRFKKLSHHGIDEDLAEGILSMEQESEQRIVGVLKELGISYDIGITAAHLSGAVPPSIKSARHGTALQMCHDSSTVLIGLLRIGAIMRNTTTGSWMRRPLHKIDSYFRVKPQPDGEKRDKMMEWLLSEPEARSETVSTYQSEALRKWRKTGATVQAEERVLNAIFM